MVSLSLHYPHAPSGRTRIRSHGLRHARFCSTSAFVSTSLCRSLRSLRSHTRFARTLARTPWAGTRAMWCRYCSIIRTLPLVTRGYARTADATLAFAHAPRGRTRDIPCLLPFAFLRPTYNLYRVAYTPKTSKD